MNDERLDETLRRAAADYHRPPAELPREAMWAAIQGARRGELGRRAAGRRSGPWRWVPLAAGVAAALLLGIGLGRLSVQPLPPAQVAADATTEQPQSRAYQVATAEHLARAETLLTSFRAASRPADDDLVRWATELLSTTRLLIDSPAGRDPAVKGLLEDLELVLAQISHLPATADGAVAAQEAEIARQAIDQGGVLPTLRTAIPAGAPTMRTLEEV